MSVWGRLRRRREQEARLDAELRDHLERQAAEYVRSGLPEGEARRRAQLDLGGLEQVKEACRDARGTRPIEDLGQDLRYGLRVLRRSPTFTAIAVLSLALGIGANTAIFTLVDSLLLRSLPVRDPESLVRLEGGDWTNPIWEAIRDQQDAILESTAAFADTRFDLAPGGEARPVEGLFVSGSFFDVLGVPAILGRTLTVDDDRRGGGTAAAVISYGFWQRHFGGSADTVGRGLVLNNVPFTVVGVTPPSFFGPSVGRSFDVAVAIAMVDRVQLNDRSWLENRSTWWLQVLGRRRPGQTVEEATRSLRRIQPRIRAATLPERWRPDDMENYLREGLTLVPAATGFSGLRRQYERPLLTVMGVVVLVLLVACANLASLLLARANARRHELGARLALGASRGRLLRQLLTESLLLAAPGGVLGLVLAHWGTHLLVGQITSEGGPTRGAAVFLDLSLHWRVLLFTLGVTVVTAVLFGIAPALRAGRFSPQDALRQQGRGLAGDGSGGLAGPLVVVQVALSLVLVVGSGLFLRTFSRLSGRDLGLESERVLLVSFDAPRASVGPTERAAFLARVEEAVRRAPGVAGAAFSVVNPVSGMGWNQRFAVPGRAAPAEGERLSWMNATSPGWLEVMGTPLLAGRRFSDRDRDGAPRVAIVNEAFVRRFIGGESPIGRLIETEGPSGDGQAPLEIVGLVEDAVYRSPRDPMEPTVYLPIAQLGVMPPFATLAVRSAEAPPAYLARDVANAVAGVDPTLSLAFRQLSDQIDASVRRERLLAGLSGFFGLLALLLAGIGLYGVTAYAVSRRRAEIGVRMALGAEGRAVIGLVLGRSLRLVGLGVALGGAASASASRLVASLLYELEPGDPATLAVGACTLMAVGLLGAGLPALRATRIDPAEVLREG